MATVKGEAMRKPQVRHYTEEELLLYLMEEEPEGNRALVSAHVAECYQCKAVLEEYQAFVQNVQHWEVPDLSNRAWQEQKARLMEIVRQEPHRRGLYDRLVRGFQALWNYALENPLPTLGYVAVALAFASERTITLFRLDRVLPAASEILEILRQLL